MEDRIKKINRLSLEQYNQEIDEAIERVVDGDFFTQEEIEKQSKEW